MQVHVRRSRGHLGLLLLFAACGGSGGVTTPPPPAAVASVTLSQSAATLTPQQTVTLTATTKDAAGNALTGRTITWSTSNAAVATVSGGLVTAIAVGSAVITAASEGQTGSATITVAAVVVPVATVTLNQTSASIASGQTVTLIATTKDALGNVLTGRGVTWSSTATGVATVDGNGVVTPVAVGTTTVTATSETKTASATITVVPGTFLGPAGGTATGFSGNATVTIPAGALSAGLAITIGQVTNPQASPQLAPGTAYDFGPTGTTFTSPVTLAIKYDPTALAVGTNQAQLRVHKLVGTTWTPLAGSTVNTTTHVVTGATSSFSTYAVLEVLIPVSIVAITPNPVDLPLGMQVQLTATTKDAQGNVLTGRTVTWQSSVTGTATIAATGLVTSVAVGTTTVTATSEGIPTTMTLNVRSDPSSRTLALDKGTGAVNVPGRGTIVIPGTFNAPCAIGADQKGYCWGQSGVTGSGGAVGDGTLLDRSVPTAIALSASLVDITVGGGFGCALDTSHNAWCWGVNNVGEFGNGTASNLNPTPVAAGGGRKFVDLSAGEAQVCGIEVGGATDCWGRNDLGTLGIGFTSPATSPNILTPTRISNDPGLVTLSVGVYTACGLTATGAAYCWGSLGDGPFGPGGNPTAGATLVGGALALAHVSVGFAYACGLTMDRRLYCWGTNGYGQLGDGTTTTRATPVLVAGGMTWRFVTVGNTHTCAITTDNRTFCWGSDTEGETGDGTLNGSLTPVQVGGGVPPLAVVSAGVASTCGLAADGSGYCWGSRGGLGDGDYFYSSGPVQVVGAQNAQDVMRGSPLGCYVNTTKLLMCWAENENETSAQLPAFGAVAVKAGAAGPGFACVILDANSHISCWGANDFGELGNGSTTAASQPTPISSTRSFTSVAVGFVGTCGVSTLSELFCWGYYPNGVNVATPTPVQLLPATSWVSVWGGSNSGVCAISAQATAYCGQVSTSLSLVPGSQHWVMMSVNNYFVTPTQCGLTDTGDAYCMGDNSSGQLGDGTTTTRNTMTAVTGGLKFTQIVAANLTTCALTAAGAAYCWGDGTGGQLGSVPGANATTPTLVPGGLHFTKLAGGPDGICGVTSAGSVYCWGTRANSSLGNGVLDDERTPVAMIGGKRFLLYEPGSAGLRAKQP